MSQHSLPYTRSGHLQLLSEANDVSNQEALFFFFWLIAVRTMRKTAVNQLSSYRRRWQTVSVKLFFFLFFLSECEVTQKVSASRYVYAPYHLPQTARKIIWHTEGTETFQWVSGVTELLLCLWALRIFPAFFHLIWKGPFRIGCRRRQPRAQERSGGCESCVRWLCGERKHLPSIPPFD